MKDEIKVCGALGELSTCFTIIGVKSFLKELRKIRFDLENTVKKGNNEKNTTN